MANWKKHKELCKQLAEGVKFMEEHKKSIAKGDTEQKGGIEKKNLIEEID